MTGWLLYMAESPSGRRYIGITSKTLAQRKKSHRNAVTSGSLIRFHRAFRKYGDAMIFTTLVVGSKDYILELEPKMIALYRTLERRFGYNVALGGTASPMLSPGVVEKIAASNRGQKRSPEQCKRMTAHFPAIHTPEFYADREAKLKALKATPKYKAKFRKSLLRTYESKPEIKKRLAQAARDALSDPMSPLAVAHKARVSTPEWKEYRRQAMIALNADPVFKAAQRERSRARMAAQRAADPDFSRRGGLASAAANIRRQKNNAATE